MAKWYCAEPGKQPTGPYSLQDLQLGYRSGKIGPQTLLWKEGEKEWLPLARIPALAAAMTGPETSPPSSPGVASGNAAASAPAAPSPQTTPPPAQSSPRPKETPVPAASDPTAAPAAETKVSGGRKGSGRFLGFLHRSLPKPVLFGLYGALGGLLGALLLGEAIWLLLHPKTAEVAPLKLAMSPEITVYPGSSNKFAVMIARLGMEGPVHLSATAPMQDVTFGEVLLPAEATEGEFQVTATGKAALGNHEVKVQALGEKGERVTQSIRLKIEAPPPSLRMTIAPSVTVFAGHQNRFPLKILRQGFTDPVRVEVLDLPKNVRIPLITIGDKATDALLDVAVAKGVEPGAHVLQVKAHSLANHKIVAQESFRLDIWPPPGKLQMTAPPQVAIYPGDKNRFTVRVARHEFKSPIQVYVEGQPQDILIAPVDIPDGKDLAVLEISAGKNALAGKERLELDLKVQGRATSDPSIAATQPLKLVVTPPPPTLQLAASPKVSVYPGGSAKFVVKIARQRFEGPVTVRVPAAQRKGGQIFVAPITIEADKSEGELEVAVDDSALGGPLPRKQALQVQASGTKGPATTANLPLELLAPPSDLQLTLSPEVDLYQGGKGRFKVRVARTGFLGPVQVRFEGVPPGVTLPAATIPAGATEVELLGEAKFKTKLGKHPLAAIAAGPKAPDGKVPQAKADFALNVKELDPSKRPPALDVVFVLDVSNSMDPQIQGVRNGVQQFIEELAGNEIKARIGMVAFRDITFDDEPLKVLKFDKQPFTTDIKAFAAEVGKLKATGGGDGPESSFDALKLAAEQPFEEKSLRVLILITDALPQTKANSTKLGELLKVLQARKVDQLHLVIGPTDRKAYLPLQKVAKGTTFDLHKASKKAGKKGGFADLLPILSQQIITDAVNPEVPVARAAPVPPAVKGPPSPTPLDSPPPPAGTPPAPPPASAPAVPKAGEVAAPPVVAPRPPETAVVAPPRAEVPNLQGVQSTDVFAEEDRLQLLLAIALWTAVLAAGIAVFLVTGQRLYLHQAWPSWRDAGRALLAGFGAGLLGGGVGQWFFQSTSGSAGWVILSRVLAWTLLGGLLGAAMGFIVPNLKTRRAFLGGCLGGFVGALGFALCSLFADAAVGRWLGAGLVGLCIGLMIALAEVAFRRYWLELSFGPREVRTVTLGPATVAVGGDEKAAAVFVPNAPAKAFGFRVQAHRVICEDFAAQRSTEVAPGDERELAGVKIKVCSVASARPTGATLRLIQVRHLSLMDGMPLTTEDIPGLEPQGSDGVVALVSRRPNDPNSFLLRNRSKKAWTVLDGSGQKRTVEPGLGIELHSPCEIDFGQARGKLDPGRLAGDGSPPQGGPERRAEDAPPPASQAAAPNNPSATGAEKPGGRQRPHLKSD